MSPLERELPLRDYSVSNRGLRPNLIGTPVQIAARMRAYADAGLDLFLIQCSPMLEEIERIGTQVLPLLRQSVAANGSARESSPARAGREVTA